MTAPRLISIIIPSFNDERIVRAIKSVRYFDDNETVSILVVDGGSKPELRQTISDLLTPSDVFICEADKGIFDALNKGLARCETDFVGWLGSDDIFSGRIRASQVEACLQDHEMLVTDLAHFRGDRITRLTHALPSRARLAKVGLNNPHFATFGRRTLFASRGFTLGLRSCADVEYFIELFQTRPRVATIEEVGVIAEEGGYSTASPRKILALNWALVDVYARYVGRLLAPLCVGLRLSYKAWSAAYYRVFRKSVRELCAPGLLSQLGHEI